MLVYGQGEQLYPDGTATDQDGNPFLWINYNGKYWSIFNATVEKYRDGTPIPQVTDATEWANLTKGAWCYYDNDPSKGKLYNWYATQGIFDEASLNDESLRKEFAPNEWSVSDYYDWDALTSFLVVNGYNFDGTTLNDGNNKLAKSLASKSNWNTTHEGGTPPDGSPGNDLLTNDKSGFRASPNGNRNAGGTFGSEGRGAYFWSPMHSLNNTSNKGFFRSLWYVYWEVNNDYSYKRTGMSVRFVRDASTASTNDYSNAITIYPNPTTSIVTIEDGAVYDIEVFSLQGRKLMTHRGNSIDLSALSNAMYLIKAINTANKQQQIYKVIKE